MRLDRLYRRLQRRDERGFGLVELLIAMNVMAIGIFAIFAMLQAGIIQVRRASTITTAAALAESEIENYRAIRYDSIGLAQSDVDAISPSDAYKLDSAYVPASLVVLGKCGVDPAPCTSSVPTQTKTGADSRQYRVDTFMAWQTVSNGRNVKLITVVVRDAAVTKVLARVISSFDESTGL